MEEQCVLVPVLEYGGSVLANCAWAAGDGVLAVQSGSLGALVPGLVCSVQGEWVSLPHSQSLTLCLRRSLTDVGGENVWVT